LVAACGGEPDGATGATRSVATAPSDAAEPGVELLPVGSFQVFVDADAHVTALANQVNRGAVLAAIAEQAGFTIELRGDGRLGAPVDLNTDREPLELVLARLLQGVPHSVAYDDEGAAPRLSLLAIGSGDGVAISAAGNEPRSGRKRLSRRVLTREEEREHVERVERMRAESLARLDSSDPEVRSDGVQWVDVTTTEGFAAAKERLAIDESPEVRVAAAEALIEGDVGAVQPLLQALEDPDQRVVLAALDALEFVGDETTVPHLEPLLKHRDVEIRERTVEAIEFLE
jgi:hypothetical protein